MLTHFDHITVATRDLDAALGDYQRVLGRDPSWRGEYPDVGLAGAHFALANGIIELIAPLPGSEEAEGLREWLASRGEGLQAIALRTNDADALRAGLRERGVRASLPQAGEARSTSGEIRRYRTVELSPQSTRGLSVFTVERSADDLPHALDEPAPDAVHALDHVVIRSAAPAAAIALYRDALGIRLALDRDFAGTRMLFFRIGGVTLEVVEDSRNDGADVFYGAAYRVRDIHAAHARMRASGLELSEVRAGNKPGTLVFTVRSGTAGVPTLILRDPAREPP
ncbi:MAG TPA: VOC family protein [Polyangiaceae bacterium]|nr:VOC family protein [Polyangiaceae bacterium]